MKFRNSKSYSYAAILLFVNEVSARGQILGALNEVDDDNNIVGDQPFYYGEIPARDSTLK